ncbi:unnamed protein product [Zymoseptoria tritici ST99CH_1A5]|uniref:Uncharacterized protein n=1 Tax=Zymoseptoria tritici ST99CH_1A5 TaxID=1276529 RepID=A0A1Y6L8F6_ZYMTR|nr:unnamed protein product [Zymoseptoria tritici ST99CH_1A5]
MHFSKLAVILVACVASSDAQYTSCTLKTRNPNGVCRFASGRRGCSPGTKCAGEGHPCANSQGVIICNI